MEKKEFLMDFGMFSSDLRRQAEYTDLGFGGFPLRSSLSNGFHFPNDRTTPITNPFPNHHQSHTSSLMAEGLSQKLKNLGLSDDERSFFTPIFKHSGFYSSRNLDGFSRIDHAREGLFHGESSKSMRGGVHRFEQDLREGLVQRSHAESSMRGYHSLTHSQDPFLDYHKVSLLGLQEAYKPIPSFNHPSGLTENMSLNNRDYLFQHFNAHKSRLSFHEEDVFDPLMYTGNRIFPPSSAMGGSRELEVSATRTKNKAFYKEGSLDLPLNLASMVDIYGSVYSMAKDQLGCRFLQKFIEGGRFVDIVIIFNQVINHVIELGIDPFGNYFVQKLLQVCDDEQRTQILIRLTSEPGLLVTISINTYGTRVVQKLIETSSTKEQISLVKSALKPGFLSLVNNSNGNHVILNCLKFLGPNDNKFILEAATKFCKEIATHRHGCCVLKHCLDYAVGGKEHEKLVAEISRNSLALAQDQFGNYVVQDIIEKKVGVDILFELRGNYVRLATQKFGSHVVEKCIIYYPESRSQIVDELISVPNFEHLIQDQYANYVIQSALSKTKGFVRGRLVRKVRRYENLKNSPYCKRLFSKTHWKN